MWKVKTCSLWPLWLHLSWSTWCHWGLNSLCQCSSEESYAAQLDVSVCVLSLCHQVGTAGGFFPQNTVHFTGFICSTFASGVLRLRSKEAQFHKRLLCGDERFCLCDPWFPACTTLPQWEFSRKNSLLSLVCCPKSDILGNIFCHSWNWFLITLNLDSLWL